MKNIEKEIKELEKELDSLTEKRNQLKSKIKTLKTQQISDTLKLEGTYIKYTDEFDNTHYLKVDWIREDNTVYTDSISLCLKGYGFSGEFLGYDDATSFDWSYFYELYVHGRTDEDFKEKAKKVQVITKEEFDTAFEEMLNKLKEYHNKQIS